MSDPFDKATEFINGKMTARTSPGGNVPSPPSAPGDPLRNRRGDIVLAAVTTNEPSFSLPVDSDESPTLASLFLDTSGRLRVLLSPNLKITGTIISGTVTQTVSLTISQ